MFTDSRVAQEIQRRTRVVNSRSERPSISSTGQHKAGKADCEWLSSIDGLNVRKTAGYKKRECFENHLGRFEHVWKATELGVLDIWLFLAERNIAAFEQPTYPSGLDPCDFFPFPELKGIRFEGVEAVKRSVTTELRGIPEELFQQYIKAFQRRREKDIRFEGVIWRGNHEACYSWIGPSAAPSAIHAGWGQRLI